MNGSFSIFPHLTLNGFILAGLTTLLTTALLALLWAAVRRKK